MPAHRRAGEICARLCRDESYVGDPVGTADVVKLDGWLHTGIPEHVRFVDEFPATLSGKIQKYKIRAFEIGARCLQSMAKTATP